MAQFEGHGIGLGLGLKSEGLGSGLGSGQGQGLGLGLGSRLDSCFTGSVCFRTRPQGVRLRVRNRVWLGSAMY